MIRYVQGQLNQRFGAGLVVDGLAGRATANAFNLVTALPRDWTPSRKLVGFIQYMTHKIPQVEDLVIDGLWGALTQNAYNEIIELNSTGKIEKWRDKLEQESPKYEWPRYKDIESVFGKPGEQQTSVSVPYTLTIAWDLDKRINRFTCHKKIAEPIQAAMEEIYKFYGINEIKRLKLDLFGGCFNNRKMRGGSRLSTHAYSAALDWNPVDNRLRWNHKKALFAKPEYVPFFDAWERVGAVSLGRARDFDWQHVQFVRL